MANLDRIPQARVVRAAGQAFAPPPPPRTAREPNALVESAKSAVALAVGMWPLTGALLLMLGFFLLANVASNP